MSKIIIAGGSGFIGTALVRHFSRHHEVVVLSRTPGAAAANVRYIRWDGRQYGPWAEELNGASVLINLTGRNVNCRYTAKNKKEILESRILSTRVLGEAVTKCDRPPDTWIQMSSATIYRHSEDKPMDETFGEIGDDFSMNVCKQWEDEFNRIRLPRTRKVILRSSIVIGPNGGAFKPLLNLVRFGLGGRQGSGNQFMSWIHISDLVDIVGWMIQGNATGTYNVTAPQPIRNTTFMAILSKVYGAWVRLPSPTWLLQIGAAIIGTETELALKSRWVIPKRLIQEGYRFSFPTAESAIRDILCETEAASTELRLA